MKHSWFRLYVELLDDPKVGALPDDVFRTYIHLMCLVASRTQPRNSRETSEKHGRLFEDYGRIPDGKQVCFSLRIRKQKWQRHRNLLIEQGLIDRLQTPDGEALAIHGWERRQYLSDSSSERVRRFRNVTGNVSCNAHETAPDTDTEYTPLTPLAGGGCDTPDFAPDFDALNLSWPRNRRATPDQIARALVGLPAYAADPAGTWRRITANARNYLRTPEAARGIVQRLDRWISSGGWLHHDEGDAGETPLVSVDQYERWLEEDAR